MQKKTNGIQGQALEIPSLEFVTRHARNFIGNAFLASFAIAGIQGGLVIYQYRSNPAGALAVPPGPTFGIEDFRNCSVEERSEILFDNDVQKQLFIGEALFDSENNEETLESKSGKFTFFSRINKFLVFMIPWLSKQVSYILEKRGHLLHIGFIMSLVSILDIGPFKKINSPKSMVETSFAFDDRKENINMVVIGDSYACGIGCITQWDKEAQNAPFKRIENTSYNSEEVAKSPDNTSLENISPIFPKSFARTLSYRTQRPIKWRSAGVDGGDVVDIRTHCLGVIEEEVNKGQTPDVVVVLCGMNDLKKLFVKPLFAGLASEFRSNLVDLITSIHEYAPNAKILFPALPTHKLEKNSVLNIFPLSFFLDVMISLWDWQKKRVADSSSSLVMHLDLSGKEVGKWYRTAGAKNKKIFSDTLIAADGVHPNSRCYARWGQSMANKFCNQLEGSHIG